MLVFAGSAQFAAVDILGDGGTVAAAVAAGLLLNLRSLAFGLVMAPALAGTARQKLLWSQLMIDESTAVGSAQTDLRWRRYGYLWAGGAVFVAWNLSTLLGATALPASEDLVTTWGIDAAIPAVFLALLWPRLRQPDQRRCALTGALVALALVPFAPAGVPIVAASLGVLAGRRRPRSEDTKSAAVEPEGTEPNGSGAETKGSGP